MSAYASETDNKEDRTAEEETVIEEGANAEEGLITEGASGSEPVVPDESREEPETQGEAAVTINVKKAANTMKVKGGKADVAYSKLKKKSQSIARSKVITFTDKGQGTKTYSKASGPKKITVDKTTGKITLAKGMKKDTYTVVINVTAAGNSNYEAVTTKVTVKIRVK